MCCKSGNNQERSMACAVPDLGQRLTLPSNLRIYKPTIPEVCYFDLFKETIMYVLIMVTFNHC